MRLIIAMAAFLAFLPTAKADTDSNATKNTGTTVANNDGSSQFMGNDSGGGGSDKQFTHFAEFRVRYQFNDNQSGSSSISPDNGNTVEQRLKLGGTYKVSEKFAVSATFLNNTTWGSSDLYVYNSLGAPGTWSSGNSPGQPNGATATNLLMVQEAYGSWMMSDDLVFKFGRGLLQLGDGSVIGTNDYEPTPNSFDGVLGTYDMDFGRLSAWVVKFAVYDNGMYAKQVAALNSAATFPANAGTSGNFSSDPEADSYGIAFDFKRLPEWLKMVNVHVIEDTKAATPGAAYSPLVAADPISTMGQNILRYGLAVNGSASIIDYGADFAGMTGNYYCEGSFALGCNGGGAANGFNNPAITKLSTDAYMAQATVGVNFPDFMKARIFARYHYDSGDSASDTNKVGTYDPFYYNKIDAAGMMEVVGWGNLSFYNAGLTVMPTDQTTVGLAYFYFQKTSETGRMNAGTYGDMVGLTSPNSKDLGQEIDLWAEHKYDGGFSILARVGGFMPGTSIKNGIGEDPVGQALAGAGIYSANASRSDMYTQAMVQGKIAF